MTQPDVIKTQRNATGLDYYKPYHIYLSYITFRSSSCLLNKFKVIEGKGWMISHTYTDIFVCSPSLIFLPRP